MWRLRKISDKPNLHDLKVAIMKEIGTDPRTRKSTINTLKTLKYIRLYKGKTLEITNEDLKY